MATNTNNPSTGSNNNISQQSTFYRLKVEDALSYLDQVKLQFARQPDVYNQFLDIMKEFKSQSIDTPGVISRVSQLFRGHTDLIEGFNTFLPPGYKIEVQANDSVHVTSPNSNLATVLNPPPPPPSNDQHNRVCLSPIDLNNTANVTNVIGTLSTNSSLPSTLNIQVANVAINDNSQPQIITVTPVAPLNRLLTRPSSVSTPPPPPPSQQLTATTSRSIVSGMVMTQSQQATQTLVNISNAGLDASQRGTGNNQVEFGHAISYVNKIKNRFQSQPDIYKAFLDILHTYQKQQKSIKDGVFQGQYLSEAEVYAKVAKLFKNQEDLLQEFSQFLPDANREFAAATANASPSIAGDTNNSGLINAAQIKQLFLSATPNDTQVAQQQQHQHQAGSITIGTPIVSQQAPSTTAPVTTISTTTTATHQTQNSLQKSASGTLKTPKYNKNKEASINNLIKNKQNGLQSSSSTSLSNTNGTASTQQQTHSLKRSAPNASVLPKKARLGSTKINNNTPTLTTITNNNSLHTASSTIDAIQHVESFANLNDSNFFDYVKKVLRSPEVFNNFLRCISLYNQQIIGTNELLKLVEPFIGKFPELLKWFKQYASDKTNDTNKSQSQQEESKSKQQFNQENNTKIELPIETEMSENLIMEIDYSSCKQYGVSYREIKTCSQQIVCSGQTALCREVLNDMYVSFPSVTDESSFVSSKKNQYEELLFRTEDERFELDVILETNISTIRLFESLQKKMSRMSAEELAKYKLDNTLGGSSETLHIKAIQRIYNEKAKELIEGLKKNPAVAVPLVLKRLRAKDEEWRAAKRDFERIWREQTEKNYLKSLDYCSGPFKQADIKQLKPKTLLNEIENIYHQQKPSLDDQNTALSSRKAHLNFKYEDRTILEDTAALIIHHVKRQTGIQKEDKQKMKQILYHFMPDLMFVPRGALSDDEADDDEDDDNDTANENSNYAVSTRAKREKKQYRHTDTNKRRLTEQDDTPKEIPEEYKSLEDMYRLFFVNDHWYLFFRYHQILCERLHKIYKIALNTADQQHKISKARLNSKQVEPVAEALGLKIKSELQPSEYYPTFLDIVRNLLDGNIDNTQYEDALREMFGIYAFTTFTLDKVVQYCVRHLQHIVQEESCVKLQDFFHDEQKTNMSGQRVANMMMPSVLNAELAYQKKAEALNSDRKCYRIMSFKNLRNITMELLDTETQDEENEAAEIEKYSEYLEKYIKEEATRGNQITDEIKEYMLQKPVFLTRNTHILKQKSSITNDSEITNDTLPFRYKILSKQPFYQYRKNSLKNAKKCHQTVTKTMYDCFKKHLTKWLKENSISTTCLDNWLLDETDTRVTTCIKETSIKRTPYHFYYKYKTELIDKVEAIKKEHKKASSSISNKSTISKTLTAGHKTTSSASSSKSSSSSSSSSSSTSSQKSYKSNTTVGKRNETNNGKS